MKLSEWLAWKQVSQDDFAKTIEVSRPAVSGYAAGNHIPGRETMLRIVTATDGAVQPGDFYGEPA